MPASRSSCSRWLRTLEDTPPHRVCSSRNVAAGSFRSSQRIRSVQRRPSRSSTAMTARPLVDPRKGRPGSGARFADLSRLPGPGRSWLTRSAPAAARRWLSASTSEARLPGHDSVRSRTMGSELMETSYDVIIVGAGSAGATVAARLTQDPRVRVLLLEAGGRDRKPAIHIPAAFPKLFRTAVDWNYDTEPQPGLGDRRVYWPRGKTLGGSSSINAMVWVRGFAADYDHWAAVAGSGWGWESALECFRRIETTEDAAGDHQGRSGPMSVSQLRDPNPLTDAFLQACTEVGLGRTAPSEINGPSPEGVAQTPVTQRRGRRCSTADAYLKPARRRPNLTVLTGALTTRVLFQGTRAVGVEYRHRGAMRQARADAEVVLSAGAINTPALLMCSGIGPADHLRSLAIPVLADFGYVGQHRDGERAQVIGRPDAGAHQQRGCIDRSRGQDDLGIGARLAHRAPVAVLDTDRTSALEQDPSGQRASQYGEVRSPPGRLQIGVSRAAPAPAALSDGSLRDPLRAGAVDLARRGPSQPDLGTGLKERIGEWVRVP